MPDRGNTVANNASAGILSGGMIVAPAIGNSGESRQAGQVTLAR